jgi:hypothetical protein
MQPDIRWITAVYGDPEANQQQRTHIGVPRNACDLLRDMTRDLLGTEGLIALYMPLGTEDFYNPGPMWGRVIGLVELLPMPQGRGMEDY